MRAVLPLRRRIDIGPIERGKVEEMYQNISASRELVSDHVSTKGDQVYVSEFVAWLISVESLDWKGMEKYGHGIPEATFIETTARELCEELNACSWRKIDGAIRTGVAILRASGEGKQNHIRATTCPKTNRKDYSLTAIGAWTVALVSNSRNKFEVMDKYARRA